MYSTQLEQLHKTHPRHLKQPDLRTEANHQTHLEAVVFKSIAGSRAQEIHWAVA